MHCLKTHMNETNHISLAPLLASSNWHTRHPYDVHWQHVKSWRLSFLCECNYTSGRTLHFPQDLLIQVKPSSFNLLNPTQFCWRVSTLDTCLPFCILNLYAEEWQNGRNNTYKTGIFLNSWCDRNNNTKNKIMYTQSPYKSVRHFGRQRRYTKQPHTLWSVLLSRFSQWLTSD